MKIMLTPFELFLTIFFIAFGTVLTRFLPFFIFSRNRKVPPFVQNLQAFLPSAAIGLLVVYCFRHLNFFSGRRGLPEVLAAVAIVLLHRTFKNTLLSISGGTILYMFLIQKVF